jgi:hypothetical protein
MPFEVVEGVVVVVRAGAVRALLVRSRGQFGMNGRMDMDLMVVVGGRQKPENGWKRQVVGGWKEEMARPEVVIKVANHRS